MYDLSCYASISVCMYYIVIYQLTLYNIHAYITDQAIEYLTKFVRIQLFTRRIFKISKWREGLSMKTALMDTL